MTTLGSHKKKYCFVAKGILGPDDMMAVAMQIIKVCGMTPARGPRVDTYPYQGGGGSRLYVVPTPDGKLSYCRCVLRSERNRGAYFDL